MSIIKKGSLVPMLIVFLAASIFLLAFSIFNLSENVSEVGVQVNNGVQAADQTDQKAPPSPKITRPKVVYNLSGTIKEKNASSLVLSVKTLQMQTSTSANQKPEVKVFISQGTKFSRLSIIKDPDTQKQTIQEAKITFAFLKIGDVVEAISKRDITNKQEFEASQVRLLPRT